MRSEAACEASRERVSLQLDGEISREESTVLEEHLRTCADCRAYQSSLHELRRRLRLAPAPSARDLTGPVLEILGGQRERQTRAFRLKLGAVSAAAAALLVLATAIPIFDATPDVARGAEITRRVFAAARSLSRYHATFDIIERGWHRDIPTRTFSAEVWFDAPESFRLQVEDRTTYPSRAWPRNTVEVVSSPSRWSIQESYSCPVAALPGCAIKAGSEERTIVARQPFDGTLDAPRDLIVPLDSLAGPETFVVTGRTRIDGRDAYRLSLPYRQAFPLVEAFQLGGSWTTFRPGDTVDLWVDTETWFPLRFEISRGSAVLLEVETLTLEEPASFDPDLFDAPMRGAVNHGGFERGPGPSESLLPGYTAGLEPYRSGRNAEGQLIATYADGLGYLKVTVDDASRPAPLLLQSAEVVDLDADSKGFYRPAAPDEPRRLDIYSGRRHVQLAGNLRRSELVRIASSLRIHGRAPALVRDGATVVERLQPHDVEQISYARTPEELPSGYALVSIVKTRDPMTSQLVQHYMPTESAQSAAGIRIVQSPHVKTLPPSSEDLVSIRIEGSLGRWSEERGELEWIGRDGVYRAVAAPSFGLDYVVALAAGMR